LAIPFPKQRDKLLELHVRLEEREVVYVRYRTFGSLSNPRIFDGGVPAQPPRLEVADSVSEGYRKAHPKDFTVGFVKI
jgi:hypothetical protein